MTELHSRTKALEVRSADVPALVRLELTIGSLSCSTGARCYSLLRLPFNGSPSTLFERQDVLQAKFDRSPDGRLSVAFIGSDGTTLTLLNGNFAQSEGPFIPSFRPTRLRSAISGDGSRYAVFGGPKRLLAYNWASEELFELGAHSDFSVGHGSVFVPDGKLFSEIALK